MSNSVANRMCLWWCACAILLSGRRIYPLHYVSTTRYYYQSCSNQCTFVCMCRNVSMDPDSKVLRTLAKEPSLVQRSRALLCSSRSTPRAQNEEKNRHLSAVLTEQLFPIFPLFFFPRKTAKTGNVSKLWNFDRGQNIWKASRAVLIEGLFA